MTIAFIVSLVYQKKELDDIEIRSRLRTKIEHYKLFKEKNDFSHELGNYFYFSHKEDVSRSLSEEYIMNTDYVYFNSLEKVKKYTYRFKDDIEIRNFFDEVVSLYSTIIS